MVVADTLITCNIGLSVSGVCVCLRVCAFVCVSVYVSERECVCVFQRGQECGGGR